MDEARYLQPPCSLLQLALSRQLAPGRDDPSSRKLSRGQLEPERGSTLGQDADYDEPHSVWNDELAMVNDETEELVQKFLQKKPLVEEKTIEGAPSGSQAIQDTPLIEWK